MRSLRRVCLCVSNTENLLSFLVAYNNHKYAKGLMKKLIAILAIISIAFITVCSNKLCDAYLDVW